MKLTIDAEQLVKALRKVKGTIDKNSSMPILRSVVIETHADSVIFTATDLEISIKLSQNADVNEFLMTIGERKIRGIIRERQEAERVAREEAARAEREAAEAAAAIKKEEDLPAALEAEELAKVAAADADTAEEALSLIRVEYEPLPAVFDPQSNRHPLFDRSDHPRGLGGDEEEIRNRLPGEPWTFVSQDLTVGRR